MGNWIPKKKGWIGNIPAASPAVEIQPSENIVIHRPLKCKLCRSRKVHCYGADKPVLYYKCLDCAHRFKVLERDD